MTTPDPTHIKSTWEAKVFPTCIEATAGDGGPAPPEGPVLIDSWPVENQNDINSYGIRDALGGPYQAFTAPRNCQLKTVKLSLQRVGNPIGDLVVAVRDGSGEYPAVTPGGRITGSRKLDVSTVSPDATAETGILYAFDFLTPVPLVGGQKYCIVLEKVSDATGTTFTSPDYLMVGFSFTFGAETQHAGNGGYNQGGWGADDAADMIFYLYEP
jgi:hypothetical protein